MSRACASALFALSLLATAPALAQSSTSPTPPTKPQAGIGSDLDLPVGSGRSGETLPQPDVTPPVDPPPTVPTIFGLELDAESIVYVIDLSCSMNGDRQSYVDPVTGERQEGSRLDRAKAELIRSIYMLPDTMSFNIIAYTCNVRLWQPPKVWVASPSAKASAKDWILGLHASSATGTGPAVVAAFRLLVVDDETLVVLLTDGAPNCGANGIQAHRDMILRGNVLRNRVDVVGIAASGDYRAFCMGVASDNGGRYIDVP